MESLNRTLLVFNAFAKGGEGVVAPFSLKILSPINTDEGDSYCAVICPYFREKPFEIFGADGAQACELAIDFIRQMLEGQAELVDADGKSMELPEIKWDELV